MKAAVRDHWRTQVARSRRRRFGTAIPLAAAAAVAGAVGLTLWMNRLPAPSPLTAGRIERVTGAAWLASGAGPVLAGEFVMTGADLATAADGRLALRTDSGHSLRLDRETRLRVVTPGAFYLETGALYVDSQGTARGPIEIRTSRGTIRDAGTQFEVRWQEASLEVSVREGAIVFGGDDVIDVPAGRLLRVDAEGRAIAEAIPDSAEPWSWALEVAPMMAIEGQPLRRFLDWYARERGAQVRFASPELSRSAATTILRGSIDGLSLDEALDSVLATCGMSRRAQGQWILIEAAH